MVSGLLRSMSTAIRPNKCLVCGGEAPGKSWVCSRCSLPDPPTDDEAKICVECGKVVDEDSGLFSYTEVGWVCSNSCYIHSRGITGNLIRKGSW